MSSETVLVFNNKRITRIVVVLGLIATLGIASQAAGISIAIASCVVLLLSSFLARKSCYLIKLRRVSITSFWYLTYLAMIFFPSFLVYFYQAGLYRDQYLLAVESVLLTVPLGWWFSSWLLGFERAEIQSFYESAVVEGAAEGVLFRRCWLLLLGCLTLVVAYVLEVRTIPLLYMIRNPGDAIEVAFLREEALKTLDSRLSYLYYIVRGTFYPLLIAVAMGMYFELRSKKWFFTVVISITTGLLFAALTVAKSPVAMIVLVAGIFYYVYKRGLPSRKVVAVLLILVFLFPVAVMVYAARSESVTAWLVLGAIAYRLFYIPAEGVYYYFEVFPAHIPYLHGRATDKLAKLVGVPSFDAAHEVGVYAYPLGLESVSANAAFISDLHADFGLWGVLLGGFLAGVIMQAIQIFVFRRRKTITTLAVFSFLIVAFWFLNSTALPIVLLSDGALLALMVAWYLDRPTGRELVPARA